MLSIVLTSLAATSGKAPPISVLGCTEALCADFVKGGLLEAYQAEGVVDIMNVTLVPFGNARYHGDKLQCQHGPDECTANSYEQCAIDAYPDFKQHYPFYLCMEKLGSKMIAHAKDCADEAGLDYSLISSCVNDPTKSAALQEKFYALTPKDHKYTPWVVVDGKLSPSNGDKLLEEVCAAYTGYFKPKGCQKFEKPKLCLNDAPVEEA